MSKQVLDEWKLALVQKKAELQAHMKEQGIKSEMDCKDFPNCPVQEAYVKAVYDSMSKGKGGGFEFYGLEINFNFSALDIFFFM